MKNMGYKTCLADPDMWMIPKKRKIDRIEYYDYVLILVDNFLAVGDDPEEVLKRVDKYFELKPGLLAYPNIYLGARVKFMALPNGVIA